MKSIYKIAGVKRETVYSPNHVENDAAIFDSVARFLEAMGHEVSTGYAQVAGNGTLWGAGCQLRLWDRELYA